MKFLAYELVQAEACRYIFFEYELFPMKYQVVFVELENLMTSSRLYDNSLRGT